MFTVFNHERLSRNRSRLVVFAIILAFLIINSRWIWLYRRGQPLDIDEAGYLSIAFADYYALLRGGILGWLHAVGAPGIQAPATTAISALVFYVTGLHVLAGFAVPLLAGALAVALTYSLGKATDSNRVGLAAAVLVASTPVIVNFSRSYHFSMSATAVTTLALLALVRSERFSRVGWSLLFGLSLGLMPLARTVTLAFLPGIVLGGLVYTLADKADWIRRLSLFAGSLLLAVLTAATWLWPNGRLVFQYLLGYGYGAHAAEYGPAQSKFGPDAWLSMLQCLCNRDVYLPHFLFLIAGALALVVVALRTAAMTGVRTFAAHALRSKLLPLLLFVAEALVALTSTRDRGSAFFAPLVPAMMVVAASFLYRLGSARLPRYAVGTLVAIVALLASVPLLDLRTRAAIQWSATIPVLKGVQVTDGRGTIQRYESVGGYGPNDVTEPVDKITSKKWIDLSTTTADVVSQVGGVGSVVAFGFRNELYNVNTVNLAEILHTGLPLTPAMVDPILGDSVAAYAAWLQGGAASACVLLTTDRTGGDFLPNVNRAFMQQAAEETGFHPLRHWPMPDGQIVTMWQRIPAPANCRVEGPR